MIVVCAAGISGPSLWILRHHIPYRNLDISGIESLETLPSFLSHDSLICLEQGSPRLSACNFYQWATGLQAIFHAS